ncbi:MAG TPA: TlyA family RNA methyltransferase [Acidobacteria bacterium]|nr:TlyA family RNA methyltransferase [Acidobacteriota bacterium]
MTAAHKKRRLDTLLVDRGLATSRTRARSMILAGKVRLDNGIAAKAGTMLSTDTDITLIKPDHPYVSRGGIKLAHAIAQLGVSASNRDALDIGASTGGFTDVLLRAGARRVVALDVGRGQLAWSLRQDPRVTVLDRVNARSLEAVTWPPGLTDFDLVTVDVAFISLTLIVPALPPRLRPGGNILLLVKPQFEADRSDIGKGGLVKNPAVHIRAVKRVSTTVDRVGLKVVGTIESPIPGTEGNREFFLHLRHHEDTA